MLRKLSFARAKSGAAAVEFAIIAPIIILVFFGLIELSEGMNARQRVEAVASTSADLVAQSTNMNPTAINNVFAAANAIMYPYPTNVGIVISSVAEDTASGANKGKVVWSRAKTGGTPRLVGEVLDMPAGVITSGGSVVIAEITYSFTPVTHYVLGGSLSMSTKFYARPRRSVQVSWSNS